MPEPCASTCTATPRAADHLADLIPRLAQLIRECFAALAAGVGETTKIIPIPRLNVRRQSSSGMSPMLAQQLENRQHRPGTDLDAHAQAFRQNARRVFGDSSAGDMRRALAATRRRAARAAASDSCDGSSAALRRWSRQLGHCVRLMTGDLKQQLARQRIAVGMQAGGGQPEQNVAVANRLAGDHALALDRADDEAGQVVFAGGVKTRASPRSRRRSARNRWRGSRGRCRRPPRAATRASSLPTAK